VARSKDFRFPFWRSFRAGAGAAKSSFPICCEGSEGLVTLRGSWPAAVARFLTRFRWSWIGTPISADDGRFLVVAAGRASQ
jgi:hypothetical protein